MLKEIIKWGQDSKLYLVKTYSLYMGLFKLPRVKS